MYLFKQFCVHVQQPPISNQSFNTVPLTRGSAISSEVVCTIFWWAANAGSPRERWTERQLQEALGHMPREYERKAASLPARSAWPQEATISPAPCTMCQRCPCMRCWRKSCVIPHTVPFELEGARENGILLRACWDHPVVKAFSTPVASGRPEAPHGCPDSQKADVQVRVPGMVFLVPSGGPASLVPEGQGRWEVCVEASRHFSPILFGSLSWENTL